MYAPSISLSLLSLISFLVVKSISWYVCRTNCVICHLFEYHGTFSFGFSFFCCFVFLCVCCSRRYCHGGGCGVCDIFFCSWYFSCWLLSTWLCCVLRSGSIPTCTCEGLPRLPILDPARTWRPTLHSWSPRGRGCCPYVYDSCMLVTSLFWSLPGT